MGKIYVILKSESYGGIYSAHSSTSIVAATTIKDVAELYVKIHPDLGYCAVDDLVCDESEEEQ